MAQAETVPANLPDYAVGDAFLFDNGVAEIVVGTSGDTILWQIGDRLSVTAYRNFVLPRLQWETREGSGRLWSGFSTFNIVPTSLWPLVSGKRLSFTSTDVERNEVTGREETYKQTWDCRVGDLEAVTVPAGTFEVYKISCSRYQGNVWVQGYNWYYSPQVGHYVKRVFTWFHSNPVEISLVAYGPAPVGLSAPAAKILRDLVQTALEKNHSGQLQVVDYAPEGLRISVMPRRTFKTADGVFCREYEQKLTARSRTSVQLGVACRDKNGLWRSN
ncbi:MAG: hypothetical protein R3E60_02350 [Alphaproteobacteria bacterium]